MSTPNLETALETLKFLHPDGGVFELCIISPLAPTSPNWKGKAFGKKPIVAGWFRDPEMAANLATRNEAEGIYTTLNPCQDALIGRADHRLKAGVNRTKDEEIEKIQNLLIDLDPIRPEGISSTDAEHQAALEMAQIIRADLTKEGWPEPLLGDSGNGAHLIYPLDLPNDEESKNLVKAVLKALALLHQDHLARLNLEVDQGVFNPARLTKLYGTMVRKGDSTQDRPHRLARIICRPEPETRHAVPLDLLKKMGATVPIQETPQATKLDTGAGRLDVEAYLARYGREVLQVKPHGDATLYCLAECIFDPAHHGNESAIGQAGDGKLFYTCFHRSCQERTWAEAKRIISGDAKLGEFTKGRSVGFEPGGNGEATRGATPSQQDERQKTAWEFAAQLIPRIPFPWEVLPSDIADSLQQLGRACATSPYALPGAAFCMVGSIMGRTLVVSPKESWEAPLITWHLDIRASGDGKTPAVRLMAGPIHEAQKVEEKRYEEEMEAYRQLSKMERDKQPPPAPPRGYFVTDLTLEGLREDIVHSPHGGIVVIQDEISAFLSGQNQYKSKGGTDRESWLALHDGHPARVRRVGRSLYINGARVSIFGGIQPKVFRTFFAGEDGLYLDDGTLFRFLATCEPSTYNELTKEAWEDGHRGSWETLLHRAIDWVDGEIYARGGKIEKPARMILSSEAQGRFFEWRNQLVSCKDQLPAPLRGFLPKAVEYVLRLTGVIHCIQMFSIGKTPQAILTVEDLERGIKTVLFYLGQVQDALRLIENEDHVPVEISERSRLLAQTLEGLRPHLDNGRLAVKFIHEQYNLIAPQTLRIGKPRGMGAVLRAVKLTISPGKHDANGHRAAKCLIWDKTTETFIEQRLQCLQSQDWQEVDDADVEEPMTATSAEPIEFVQTLQTLEKQCLHQENCASCGSTDIADIADIGVSTFSQFSPSLNWQEVPEGVVIPPGAEIRMDMATGKNYARWSDGSDTDGLNRSSGIGETDQEDLVGKYPGESIMDAHYLVQCGRCQHFSPSPVKAGEKGSCQLYPKSSWNGTPFQSPDDPHACPAFEAKDSIKKLAAWDEAISQRVGEALNLGNNPDFKEVEI